MAKNGTEARHYLAVHTMNPDINPPQKSNASMIAAVVTHPHATE